MSGSRKSIRTLFLVWLVIARELTGLYWLYFGVQKWSNYGWIRDTLTSAALNNPIPLYGEFLRYKPDSHDGFLFFGFRLDLLVLCVEPRP